MRSRAMHGNTRRHLPESVEDAIDNSTKRTALSMYDG